MNINSIFNNFQRTNFQGYYKERKPGQRTEDFTVQYKGCGNPYFQQDTFDFSTSLDALDTLDTTSPIVQDDSFLAASNPYFQHQAEKDPYVITTVSDMASPIKTSGASGQFYDPQFYDPQKTDEELW